MASWLDTWTAAEMKEIVKRIALGDEHDAERRVKSQYAAWLKSQRSSADPDSSRRRVSELRALARAAKDARRKRDARARALREAEKQREREARLRMLMKQPDNVWQQADA